MMMTIIYSVSRVEAEERRVGGGKLGEK